MSLSDEPIPGWRPIFVFGSNLAGRHGRGSAKEALVHHGAKRGLGVGFYGNSYAIPTKDEHLTVLPLEVIKNHVFDFLRFAKEYPERTFNVVDIGCGLAGYTPEQIAPMFKNKTENVLLSETFSRVLKDISQ